MDTQREELAKHGIDHNKYEVFLSEADHLNEETTGVMVREVATGKQIEATIYMSRRQLAEPDNSVYIDTVVKMVHELEKESS